MKPLMPKALFYLLLVTFLTSAIAIPSQQAQAGSFLESLRRGWEQNKHWGSFFNKKPRAPNDPIDSTPPNLNITAPADGTEAAAGLTIEGICESGITVYVTGSGLSDNRTASCDNSFFDEDIEFSAGDGVKNVVVTQTDLAGNVASVSRSFMRISNSTSEDPVNDPPADPDPTNDPPADPDPTNDPPDDLDPTNDPPADPDPANDPPDDPNAVDISSCRTLSNSGQTYRLTADLNSDSSCIQITGSDITLDGNGHSISYTSSAADQAAVYARYASRPTVHSLTINVTNSLGSNGPSAIRTKGDATVFNSTINLTQNGDGTIWGIRSVGSGTRSIHHNTLYASGSGSVVLIAGEGVSDSSVIRGEIHHNTSSLDGSLEQSPGSRPAHVAIGRSHPTSGTGVLKIYSNMMNNVSSSLRESQGVTFYQVDRADIYDNTWNDSGGHSRAITLDYADDCNVYGNQLNQGHGGGGANQGIRLRYGSHGNEIYENTIVANGSGVFPVSVGAEGLQPFDNNIYNNNLTASDQVIRVQTNIRDFNFYSNQLTLNEGGGVGYAVYVLEYHKANGSPNVIENISFSYDQITNNRSQSSVIRLQDTGSDGPDNLSFCGLSVDGSALSSNHVSVNSGANDWTILAEPCTLP